MNNPPRQSPLVPFQKSWTPEILSWVSSPTDLVLWSGSTFPKGLSTSLFLRHLQRSDLNAIAQLDPTGKLLCYGEVVRMSARRCSFCRIIVRPDSRGLGLGKAFCQQLLDWCILQRGYTEVILNTLGNNQQALSCYQSIGFTITSRKKKARMVGGIKQDLIQLHYRKN
jgi:ribosomal protein S18 acetylase RimI-like enzyme